MLGPGHHQGRRRATQGAGAWPPQVVSYAQSVYKHPRLTQDAARRKNGALAKDSSHQACQALTLFQLEKVNCARGFEEKPSTELQGTTERSSGSRVARTNEWCSCARFVASSLPKALTLFQLEKINCARCVPRQAFPRSPWPNGVAKKLGRQRRLELRPRSRSLHGQVLSKACLTSEIDPQGHS